MVERPYLVQSGKKYVFFFAYMIREMEEFFIGTHVPALANSLVWGEKVFPKILQADN